MPKFVADVLQTSLYFLKQPPPCVSLCLLSLYISLSLSIYLLYLPLFLPFLSFSLPLFYRSLSLSLSTRHLSTFILSLYLSSLSLPFFSLSLNLSLSLRFLHFLAFFSHCFTSFLKDFFLFNKIPPSSTF